MAAQSMPPNAPMRNMAGSVKTLSHSQNRIGMTDPMIAPAVNCPSAPMFQVLEM